MASPAMWLAMGATTGLTLAIGPEVARFDGMRIPALIAFLIGLGLLLAAMAVAGWTGAIVGLVGLGLFLGMIVVTGEALRVDE